MVYNITLSARKKDNVDNADPLKTVKICFAIPLSRGALSFLTTTYDSKEEFLKEYERIKVWEKEEIHKIRGLKLLGEYSRYCSIEKQSNKLNSFFDEVEDRISIYDYDQGLIEIK